MRTLKKSLCLVLALVMVLGLCMIGANADYANYTDKKEITYAYADAVEVLTGLAVIEGRTDGTFDPKATVTRAEACAMIARMMLGREGADKLPVGDVKFNDVSLESWEGRMAKYIAFCANRGIVVGDGNGNFRPNDPVKGTELAAMLLRALGYGVMGEYEGKGWDINAVADAIYYKVFKDSEVTDFSQNATREETALYIWNTMWVDTVAYDVDIDHYVWDMGKFAELVFDVVKWENVQVEANQATGDPYSVIGGRNFAIETGLDLIAHEVTVYWQKESKDKDKDNNIFYKAYLVQDNSEVLNIGSTWASMYKALKNANKTNVLDPYNKLAKVQVWVNYVYEAGSDTVVKSVGAETVDELKGYETKKNNLSGEFVLDSDGHMLAYLSKKYTVDQVKKIVDDEVFLRVNKYAEDFETYDLALAYEGIKKGDYVTVQPVGKLCYLYETSTQEIMVTERNILVDYILFGYKMPYFNNYNIGPSQGYRAIDPPETEDPFNVQAGDKVLFYMDCYGKFWATQILERGTLDGVVYMVYAFNKEGKDDYGDDDKTVYVQCVNEKGEEVIYPLDQKTYTDKAKVANGVYQVFLDKKGYATLRAVGGELDKLEGKTTYLTSDGDTYYNTKDTKIYYINGKKKDLKVTESKSLPMKGAYPVWSYYTSNGSTFNNQILWVIGQDAPKTADSYIYAAGEVAMGFPTVKMNGGSMIVNDQKTFYFPVYVDGVYKDGLFTEKIFVANEDTVKLGEITYIGAGFYIYTVDEYGVYDLEAVEPDGAAVKIIETTLKAGDVKNGKFFYECDGVSVDVKVVVTDEDSCISNDGKRYLTINDLDDIEDILDNEGTVTVTYLAAVKNEDLVPFGTIYVISATEGKD